MARPALALRPLAATLLALAALVAACATATDRWVEVRALDQVPAYETFLREHPEAAQCADARRRIAELQEARARAQAQSADDLAGYRHYLEAYPNAPFATTARTKAAQLEEAADWQACAALADLEQFVARYPGSSHLAAARERIAKLHDEQAFAAAQQSDTAAAWLDFARRFPRSAHRTTAGQRLELLGADDALLAQIRTELAKHPPGAPNHPQVFLADVQLAPAGTIDHLLCKDPDYGYSTIDTRGARIATDGLEHATLRAARPREFVVLRLTRATLCGSDRDFERAFTSLLRGLAKHCGTDPHAQRVLTIWPRDTEAARLPSDGDTPQVSMLRGCLANALTTAELAAMLGELGDEHRGWALDFLERHGWQPTNLRERLAAALTRPEPTDAPPPDAPQPSPPHLPPLSVELASDPATTPALVELGRTAAPALLARIAGALAHVDPSGVAFDQLAAAVPERTPALETALIDVLLAEPALAARVTGTIATRARDAAREHFTREFEQLDGEPGRVAAAALPYLGWDPELPAHRVRTLALHDRWDAIGDLGPTALEPLFDLLVAPSFWGDEVVGQLQRIAATHGASPIAERRLLANAEVRAELRLRWSPALRALFSPAACQYMETPAEVDAMRAFAATAPAADWAALARQWGEDAAPAPWARLVAEGKLTVQGSGAGIESVDLQFHNRTDHRLVVQVPAGVQCAPDSGNVQNMVTRAPAEVQLEPSETSEVSVPAACANLHRAIPDGAEAFAVHTVPPASDLGKALAAIAARDLPYPVSQAAVWILTDDATRADLGTLVTSDGLTRVAAITLPDMVCALQLLDEVGVAIRTKRLWHERDALLRDLEPGPLRVWLEAQH